MTRSRSLTVLLLTAVAAMGACTSVTSTPGERPDPHDAPAPLLDTLPLRPLWLLGEQHDAPAHQALQLEVVRTLAGQGRLAAVVIEMAEAGHSTAGLDRDADEARVRASLDWSGERNEAGWPWTRYGPMIMNAVRAGVPVLGGNLPRSRQRQVMAETSLDGVLDANSLARQQALVRDGHCGLLPESQIAPMTRIQLARDRSMAEVASRVVKREQTVLLVAGNEHVRRDLGVPRHLAPDLPVLVMQARSRSVHASHTDTGSSPHSDHTWVTVAVPERDYCAELKKQLGR